MPDGNIGRVEREKRAKATTYKPSKAAVRATRRAEAARKPKKVQAAPPRPSADAAQPTTKKERHQIEREQRKNAKAQRARDRREQHESRLERRLGAVTGAIGDVAHAWSEAEARSNRNMHRQLEGKNKPDKGWVDVLGDIGHGIVEVVKPASSTVAHAKKPDKKPGKTNPKARPPQTAGIAKFPVSEENVSEAKDAILGLPGGLFKIAKDVGQDVSDIGHGRVGRRQGRYPFEHTAENAEAIGKSMYRDIRHPRRNPLMTALTGWGIASAGAGGLARGTAASRALKAGDVKGAAKAAASKPVPAVRTHTHRGQPVRGRYSTNPLAATIQKHHERAATEVSATKAERLLSEERRVTDAAAKAPALRALAAAPGRRASSKILRRFGLHPSGTVEDAAIRLVAEGVPADDVIAAHLARAAQIEVRLKNRKKGGNPPPGKQASGISRQQAFRLNGARRELLRRAALYEEAKKYLESGEPPVKPGHVRIYRGEGKHFENAQTYSATPEWIADNRGGWYTDKKFVAEEYAKRNNGRVIYADVPEDIARNFGKERIWGMNADPWMEYQLPKGVHEGLTKTPVDSKAPRISSEHPELQAKYDITKTAADTRSRRAKATGLLTREAEQRRINAPGQMMRRTVSGGRAIKIERPRTVDEAQARLDTLDAKVEKIVSGMAKQEIAMNPEGYKLARGTTTAKKGGGYEVAPEDMVYRKHGGEVDIQRSGEKAKYVEGREGAYTGPSMTQMELATREVYRKLEKHKDHPVAQKLIAMIDEAQELRQALAAEAEKGTFAEGMTTGGSLGKTTEFKGFDEVEPFNAGKFRVPDVLRSQRLPHGPLAYRGGVPRKPGTLTHEYTGALRRSGKYTPHTIRAVAEDALEFERYASADRFRQRLLPMGQKVRPADTARVKYVPLKTRDLTRKESTALRKMLDEVDPETLTPDEAVRIEERLQAFERQIFPDPAEYANVRIGEAVPGVVWVDRKLLGSQRKLIGRLPVIDATSDVVKGLILYLKPGYVAPNVLGNIGYNLFQQGLLAPANWSRAVRLPRDLDFMVKEVMGAGYSRALAEGTMSPASYAVRKAGDFWSHFVDDPFRKASFLHEARRYGFKSDEQLRSLIMDTQHRSQLGEIAQRARDAIVDYERLGPLERDLVRRVLFVYPWVKGSTYYAAQFLRDHPVQAMVFEKIGEQGASEAQREIGPMPAWAKGSFKVGGSEDQPTIVNPQSVSPFSTPVQAAAMFGGLFGQTERSEQIGEATNPLLQAGIEAAFGRDIFTGRELHGSAPKNFVEQVGKGLPQYLLYKRGGLNFLPGVDEHVSPDATYPYSPADARAQFVFGSAFPRPANRAKLNEQAAGALDPAGRVKRDIAADEAETLKMIQAVDPSLKTLPKPLKQAYVRKTAVDTIRAKLRREYGSSEERELYHRSAFDAEVDILTRWKAMTAEEAAGAKKWAKSADVDEVQDARRYLVDHYFDDAYLGLIRDSRKYAKENS